MGAVHEKRCTNGHKWEVLELGGVETSLAREGDACFDVTCPTCGLDGAKVFTSDGRKPHGAGFPYYDFGLDLVLQSEQHRQQVMRERGLKPMDGEFTRVTEQTWAKKRLEGERIDREYAEMTARQNADPEVRRMRARMGEAKSKADVLAMFGQREDA